MSNQTTITAFLRGKGLTTAQIAGVEGNLKIESGFSPTAYNPGEKAIGIAQWEGPRRTALQAYARKAGTSETDLSTQLGFLWHELTTSESGALSALRGTSTPSAAAAAFDARYERSSGEARSARESAATVIARTLGLGGGIDTSVGALTPKAPKATSSGSTSKTPKTTPKTTGSSGSKTTGSSGSADDGGTAAPVSFSTAGLVSGITGVDVRDIVLEGTFVVLAVALVGGGVYRLFGPQIKAATGAAKGVAGKAAMAAAL